MFICYARNIESMFVGRIQEFKRLGDVMNSAHKRGRLLVVIGPEGAGKTTLVKEFCNKHGINMKYYRCDEFETHIPLATMRRIVNLYYPSLKKARTPESIFSLLIEQFESEKKPFVMFINNIHLADPLSLKFIMHYAAHAPKDTLLVVSYHIGKEGRELEDVLEKIVLEELAEILMVDNFDEETVDEYLKENGIKLSRSEMKKIYTVSKGNPLYLKYICEYYRISGKLPECYTFYELIEKFVNMLPKQHRDVIKIASVMGVFFFKDVINALLPDSGDAIEELEKMGLIESLDAGEYRGYVFTHQQLQKAIYKAIPEDERKKLHEKIAQCIERNRLYSGWERVHELARHYSHAENITKSLKYLELAARDSLDKKDYYDAADYLMKYERFLNSHNDDEKRAWMYGALYRALRESGKMDEAVHYQKKVISWSYLKMADVYYLRGEFKKALSYITNSFKRCKDEFMRMMGYEIRGNVLRRIGEYNKALVAYKKALKIAHELKNTSEIATLYKNIGNIYLIYYKLDVAEDYYKKAMKIFQALRDRYGVSAIYNNIGILYSHRGNFRKALEYYLKSLRLDEQLGHIEGMGPAYNNIGTVYEILGEIEMAKESYMKSIEYNTMIGSLDGIEYAYSNLSSLNFNIGNIKEAIEYARKEIKIAAKIGSVKFTASGYMQLARIYITLKEFEKARDAVKKAMDTAEKHGNVIDAADAYYYLAEIEYYKGNIESALEYLEKALDIYKKLGIEDRALHIYTLITKCKKEDVFKEWEGIVRVYTEEEIATLEMTKAVVYAYMGKEHRTHYKRARKILEKLKRLPVLYMFLEEYGRITGDKKIIKDAEKIRESFIV